MTPPNQNGGSPTPSPTGGVPATGQPGSQLESGMTPPNQNAGSPPPGQTGAPPTAGQSESQFETGMPPPSPNVGSPTPGPAGGATATGPAEGASPVPTERRRRFRQTSPNPVSGGVPAQAVGGLPSAPRGAAPVPRGLAGPVVPTMGGGTVSDIRVVGTQRIEPETVRSYLQLQPGDPWDDEKVNASLKALFATGLFADVRLSREGNTLVVKVVENPIINRIAFEGNHKLDDKELNAEIQLRPRVVYTRTRVQNDVKRILDLYRRHGRFGATVEPKIIQLSENRVDLVFEINEGEFTGIRSINFVGNKDFSESKLRGVIETKESRWYRFLSTDDSYDPDRLTYDRELLRKFYLTEGYADFRVLSAVAELTPERNGFIVTFTLDEGQRYRFGKVGVNIKLKDLPASAVCLC